MSGVDAPTGLRAYISYSRGDMVIADRLVAALEMQGFAATIDRRDIPCSDQWQEEHAILMRASDAIIWLVSAQSVRSRRCNRELGEAMRLNKRLVPLAIEAVPPEALPEMLGRIETLPAEGAFELEKHLGALVDALNADGNWLIEHTRLAEHGRQWLAQKRTPELLLRGSALKEAEAWADKRPDGAPPPNEEALELVLASRRARGRRLRVGIAASLIVALAGVGLAGSAYFESADAIKERELAREGQAHAVAAEQLAEEHAASDRAAREAAERTFQTTRQTVDGIVSDVAEGLRDVEGIRVEDMRKVFDRVAGTVGQLAQVSPDNDDVLRTQAAMFVAFGDTYRAAGDGDAALSAYDASRGIAERRAAAGPEKVAWQHQLAAIHVTIGDLRAAHGDLDAALVSYETDRNIAEQLAADGSDDPQALRDLAAAADRIGDLNVKRGSLAEALASYETTLRIRQELAAGDPNNAEWRHELSLAFERIGDVQTEQGNLSDARQSFEASLVVREKLVSADPGNTRWQHELVAAHEKIGSLQKAEGDLSGSLGSLREGPRRSPSA